MTIHDAKALIGLCIDEGLKQGVLKNKGEFEELLDYLDKYFANTDKMPNSSSEVQNDLEEAAEEYLQKVKAGFLRTLEHPTAKDCFKDGAKWDREQMMKEAVEGVLVATGIGHLRIEAETDGKNGMKHGDKVRVIVLPKED